MGQFEETLSLIQEMVCDLQGFPCETGSFKFCRHEVLDDVVEAQAIPFQRGVYLVHSLENDVPVELLYIGMSGEVRKGKFGTQTLPVRLTKLQTDPESGERLKRKKLWPKLMELGNLNAIQVTWYLIHFNAPSTSSHLLPRNVEKRLLAAYEHDNGVLPPWNKKR